MTIDDRLRALEESGADPALLRGFRLLIEQRDRTLRNLYDALPRTPDEDGTLTDWVELDNDELLAAMDEVATLKATRAQHEAETDILRDQRDKYANLARQLGATIPTAAEDEARIDAALKDPRDG